MISSGTFKEKGYGNEEIGSQANLRNQKQNVNFSHEEAIRGAYTPNTQQKVVIIGDRIKSRQSLGIVGPKNHFITGSSVQSQEEQLNLH